MRINKLLRLACTQLPLLTALMVAVCIACMPLPVWAGEPAKSVDCTTLHGKVMVGYQGWFNCEGDGSGLGWKHWARNGARPQPNNVTFDLWPDLSELDAEEKFATDFKHADGSTAYLFSSAKRPTVIRHFEWMRVYGIDGAFVQRFANQLGNQKRQRNVDAVLSHARAGAEQSGRAYAVMYDLSGLKAGELETVRADWARLRNDELITEDDTYLHHNGKPIVAVWGIGFSDDRKYSLEECFKLVTWLKDSGNSIMLGIPSFWREQNRDALTDPMLHKILSMADVVSPWTVGRYRNPQQAARHAEQVWQPDLEWCRERGIDFLPVIYPGFSWRNLNGGSLGQIPRLKGEFFWSQVTAADQIGCEMLYIAMFDEVDEATAIFKCSNNPPAGEGAEFLTYEGLPSDHYLMLAGRAAELIRQNFAKRSRSE